MTEAKVFRALGDPVRLELVRRLSAGSLYTIGVLSDGLGVTRQGARRHIQVLEDAGILKLSPEGRETMVELETGTLERLMAFMIELERQWGRRLGALKDYVENGE